MHRIIISVAFVIVIVLSWKLHFCLGKPILCPQDFIMNNFVEFYSRYICAGVRVRPADPAGFRGHPGQVDRQLPQGGAHRVDQHAPGVETVTVMR